MRKQKKKRRTDDFETLSLQERVSRLMERVPEAETIELKVFYNAYADCLRKYSAEKSKTAKQDLDAAREGLEVIVDALASRHMEGMRSFETVMEVVEYLQRKGYKIKKSKAYADRKKGLLRFRKNGTITQGEVDRYAGTLQMIGDPEEGIELKQKEKLEKEVEKLSLQIQSMEHELATRKGEYVKRTEAEMERAAMITVLEANFRNMLFRIGPDIIDLVRGDSTTLPDLQVFFRNAMDEMFRQMAQIEAFEIEGG